MQGNNLTEGIVEETDVFNDMLDSLVELLEETRILTDDERKSRMKKRFDENGKLKSCREIQFRE